MAKPKPSKKHRKNRRDTERVVRWLRAGAVVTGIGAAVINGQPVAWATESDAPATESAETTGQEPTGNDDTDPGDVQTSDSPPTTVSAQTNTSSDPEEEEPDPDDFEDLGNLDDDLEPEPEPDPEPVDDGPEPAPQKNQQPAPAPPPAPDPDPDPDPTVDPDDGPDVHTDEAAVFAGFSTAAADTDTQDAPPLLRPPTATATVTTITPTQTPEFRPIRQLVLGFLGVFGFSPTPAPGSPTPNPLLAAMWAVYRRVESFFYNDTPTAQGVTISTTELTDDGDVIVTGAIDFDDYDGDVLRYTATDGAHGSVTVNPDGTFTYTLTDPSYAGTDTFTITASDAYTHLHGLFGLFAPDGRHTRTATVTVNLTAAPNDAPVIESVTSDPGTGNSWTVVVETSDPDGDPVTVTVTPADTGKVSVTAVDGETNTYTVTVTDTDWARANPGRQLEVTVTATDGALDAAPVTLTIGTVNNVVAVGAHSNIPALPPGVTYTRVATGGSHTVLLRSDGSVVGVGANDFGQLNLPELPEGVTYVNIGAGYNHTVLLRSDGVVVGTGAKAGVTSRAELAELVRQFDA